MKRIHFVFKSINNEFKLTEKFYKEVSNDTFLLKGNDKAQYSLCRSSFMATPNSSYYVWTKIIKIRISSKLMWHLSSIIICFDEKTGMLFENTVNNIPRRQDRRVLLRTEARKQIRYFIAVMMSHGYIEKIKEISKDD